MVVIAVHKPNNHFLRRTSSENAEPARAADTAPEPASAPTSAPARELSTADLNEIRDLLAQTKGGKDTSALRRRRNKSKEIAESEIVPAEGANAMEVNETSISAPLQRRQVSMDGEKDGRRRSTSKDFLIDEKAEIGRAHV